MPTLSDFDLRGPVHTVRTEADEWDAANERWVPRSTGAVETFRPDGRFAARESRTPDGVSHREVLLYDDQGRQTEGQVWRGSQRISTTLYTYDAAGRLERMAAVAPDGTPNDIESFRYDSSGRKTRVQHLDERLITGAVSSDLFGDAPMGSRPATITTRHDDLGLPVEDISHDSQHIVVARTTYERDKDGRLLREERFVAPTTLFSGLHDEFAKLSPEERAQFEAVVAAAMPRGALSTRTLAYDQHGRVLQERRATGAVGEDTLTFRYDEHGNPIEVTEETSSREVGVDESGTVGSRNEQISAHVTRYEYQYDAHHNWTERVTSSRSQDQADFRPALRERRVITYYGRG